MRYWIITVEILISISLHAQPTDALERMQEGQERSLETESFMQEHQYRLRHPLSLNRARADELVALGASVLQAESLCRYRSQLGSLLAIEELQAVPLWDAATINRLRPYITVQENLGIPGLLQQLHGGDHQAVLRYGRSFPAPVDASRWAGSPDRIYLRYRYRHEGGLRWGITAEKDPGERAFAKGSSFDFVSAHLSGEGKGLLQRWMIGDFQANFGQGLVTWQDLAFGPGPELSLLKRQAPVLQPYTAGNEFSFFRGAAIMLARHHWSLAAFVSRRRYDAGTETDSMGTIEAARSLQVSGYHRTASELAAKGSLTGLTWGGRLQWERGPFRIGMHVSETRFSLPLLRGDAPYQLYALAGDRFANAGIDWSGTCSNLHFFGELAYNRNGGAALLQGILFSGGTRWDGALVYRRYDARYTHIYGAALDRWGSGRNEEGLYLGFQLHPAAAFELAVWGDAARTPWLRYRIDAPAQGFEGGIQVAWKPQRKLELSLRYRYQDEERPPEEPAGAVKPPLSIPRRSLRLQVQDERFERTKLHTRVEALWQDDGRSGFVFNAGLRYRTLRWGSLSFNLHFFETDDFSLRIYQFDADATGGGSILPFYGKGARYAVLFQYPVTKSIDLSLRYALQSTEPALQESLTRGGGNDLRSEWKMQLRIGF
jgi:hypothetical protein